MTWLQECMVAPTVGDATAEVLYTFDEAAPVDPLSLANLIQAKLATILQVPPHTHTHIFVRMHTCPHAPY